MLLAPPAGGPVGEHEIETQLAVARMLAAVKGVEFGGVWDCLRPRPCDVFIVARDTLLAAEAAVLKIESADHFFGGVVPHALAKTKAITHARVGVTATHPAEWTDAFADAVADFVLPGFTAFRLVDAREAAGRLFVNGPVRVKPTRAAGGRGQRVARTPDEMDAVLTALDPHAVAESGVVLETNLEDVVTYSIGQVTLDGRTVSYVGTQDETADNAGRRVYGGSELVAVRGDWSALARLDLDPDALRGVAYARPYDAATRVLAGFLASRRNYDVVSGLDGRGRRRTGVLEASWRPGGASPAEIVAFRALRDEPELTAVRVATAERYGEDVAVPADALVHFHGHDSVAGPVARYTRIVHRQAA